MRLTLTFSVIRLFAVALVLLPAAAALAEPVLTPHSAEYRVKISVLSGRLTTRLDATDTGYAAIHRIEPTGMARVVAGGTIEETSLFDATEDGVLPVHYLSHDTLSRDKTSANIAFDWRNNTLAGTVNDQPISGTLDDVVHDRVSIQYQLMHDLKNAGAHGTYTLFDIDELKTLNITLIGSREFTVPAGTFTAVGVQHQAEGSSRVTTLWCVPELDYLPIIIEQHRKGKLRLRATLSDYSARQT